MKKPTKPPMGTKVHLTPRDVEDMMSLACNIADAKAHSVQYRRDMHDIEGRYTTGLLGELACEKYFDIPVVERVADDESHQHPDIQSCGFGVKTYKQGHYPLIEKRQYYPQIFCCACEIIDGYGCDIYIQGYATPKIMMDNLDDSKIRDPRVKLNGYKSAFVGLDQLIPITKNNLAFISKKSNYIPPEDGVKEW